MQFDKFANTYTQNAFIQKDLIAWGAPFLNFMPLNNKSILELGAGTGLLTQYLLKHNPQYLLATDISPQMIQKGQQNTPNAHWQLLNAWNFSTSPVDHIFSSSLLQWAPHPQQVIANWTHNLKIGGTLHALFFIDPTLTELRQLISLESAPQWQTYEYWNTVFINNGLKIHLTRNLVKYYKFNNSLSLLNNLKQIGASLKNSIHQTHLKIITKNYDKKFKLKNELGVSSTWHFFQIIAEKTV